MQRQKLLVMAVSAILAAGGASVFLLGNAEAATWHDYKGDLYPGHAYGLQVPAQADAYEILLEGDQGATARLALFTPDGTTLGHHALDAANAAVRIETPQEGRHVLYVYDLQAGALKLRVDAPLAPIMSSLQKMPLHENTIALWSSDAAAPLDLTTEQRLDATPVFLTLLYEGSVQGLDAVVASPKGNVVTIAGESGTAFSPGVWSQLTGERRSDPANLDGLVFTVAAKAERFEGSLVLVTVTIDRQAPVAPEAAPAPVAVPVNGAFTPEVGTPMAFDATAGAIRVTRAEPLVEKESRDEHEHEGHRYWSAAFAVYRPDDSLLAYVTLNHREPNATIKLPTDGEYVVFVHDAPEDGLLVELVGASTVTAIRALPTAEEVFEFDLDSGLHEQAESFELLHAPVAMKAALGKDTVGALSWVHVVNDQGVVAGANAFVKAPGTKWFDWSFQDPEHFAAGAHAIEVSGLVEGTLTLVSVHYLREGEAPAAEPEATEAESLLGLLGL